MLHPMEEVIAEQERFYDYYQDSSALDVSATKWSKQVATVTGRLAEHGIDWSGRRVLDVNLDANLALMSAAHPLLKCAPRGGRVVVIGSKNVPAPG